MGPHSHRAKSIAVSWRSGPSMVVLALRASSFAQWAGAAPGLPGVLFAGAETEGRALAVTQGIAVFFLCQVRALKKMSEPSTVFIISS